MLKSLHISNYALIDTIDIDFSAGFNVLTGETGAGKSIILGALTLLLGSRADMKAVRDMTKKSVIEATFSPLYKRVADILKASDLDTGSDEVILRREIAASTGRSRAFVNDTPVTLDILRQVAECLVDIHSQHQNLMLANPEYQLAVVDRASEIDDIFDDYTAAYTDYRLAMKRYRNAQRKLEKAVADKDYIQYQFDQLNALGLEPGEQQRLENEQRMLANAASLSDSVSEMLSVISEGEQNAVDLMGKAARLSSDISLIDTDKVAERLRSASIELQDIRDTLESYAAKINASPADLQAINNRLDEIYTLERRHSVETVDDLIALREKFRRELQIIASGDVDLADLETDARRKKATALRHAKTLSKRRQEGAKVLVEMLENRAKPLAMKNLRCEVRFDTSHLSPTGIDAVQLLVAFNKNQEPLPIGGTASGGEISRLMLTVKSIVADKVSLPTIIFDEIDTGVSGDVANRMGKLMQKISQNIQVLAITHLPQVAALADSHYKVFKEDNEASTLTNIIRLDKNSRIDEIAAMLSGENIDESARQNARSLLAGSFSKIE